MKNRKKNSKTELKDIIQCQRLTYLYRGITPCIMQEKNGLVSF